MTTIDDAASLVGTVCRFVGGCWLCADVDVRQRVVAYTRAQAGDLATIVDVQIGSTKRTLMNKDYIEVNIALVRHGALMMLKLVVDVAANENAMDQIRTLIVPV